MRVVWSMVLTVLLLGSAPALSQTLEEVERQVEAAERKQREQQAAKREAEARAAREAAERAAREAAERAAWQQQKATEAAAAAEAARLANIPTGVFFEESTVLDNNEDYSCLYQVNGKRELTIKNNAGDDFDATIKIVRNSKNTKNRPEGCVQEQQQTSKVVVTFYPEESGTEGRFKTLVIEHHCTGDCSWFRTELGMEAEGRWRFVASERILHLRYDSGTTRIYRK